ncbi:pantetheine-phosphate adenylyltransferase [Bartonella sp. DGB2]|uniref:pantetheine-phosphate adenylyltransferase n=1 Tax=Bartonella sp. DGB2 TaxID=3388426 RepID=UPI00398FC32C
MKIAIYAGSFDPITNGHMDVLRGALALADQVVVAIGIQPNKVPLFSYEEREALIYETATKVLKAEKTRLRVITFDNLLVRAAQEVNASFIIRGLRDGTDLDYEMQMAGMNGTMAPELQTVFLPASVSVRAIAATLVRQIAAMGGDISPFVPQHVATAIKKKFQS